MKKVRPLLLAIFVLLLAAARSRAAEPIVLPDAVESAVLSLLNGGTRGDVDHTRENGETVFEIEIVHGDIRRTHTFDTEGVPISTEVFEAELPPAVRTALHKELGADGKLDSIVRTFDEGLPGFDFEITRGEQSRVTSMRPNGRVTSREIAVTELPAGARRAANARLGGGKIEECFKVYEGGETYYVVSIEQSNRTVAFTFGPGGRVWGQEERISFSAAPAPVQKAILGRVKTSDHVRVTRRQEENDVEFEVLALRQGALDVFLVSPSGRISRP